MKYGPEELRRLSDLFDEALAQSTTQRDGWISRLEGDAAALQAPLRSMLARHAADGSDAVLTQGTRLAMPIAIPEAGAGERIGPYELVERLGSGGMGEVWRAEQADGRMHRTVALKLPHAQLPTPMLLAHFARERDILATLDHPCIAKLFDAGVTQEGQPFLALQYVPGQPLTRHADDAALDVPARVRLFIELLGAVQHAHSALVIHRDIKPNNVFVTPEGRVMLLDFGIGKLLGPRADSPASAALTEFTGGALTPDYASPEQVAGRPVATASDIYSLGVLLYELLCGERPYRVKRSSRAALEEAILEHEIQPPSTRIQARAAERRGGTPRAIARVLRGDLDAIVRKAMAREPAQRYATAQSFAEDLHRWLRSDPVLAQPDRFGYRAGRFLARRWRGVAVAAAVAGVVVASAVVARQEAAEARSQRAQAEEEARKARAVVAFLQNLLTQNSLRQPDPAAARQRTAEQLLDDGARQIATGLKEAPEARQELLATMAEMYVHMRLPAKGVELYELRARQAESLHGAQSAQALGAWLQLAFTAFGNDLPDGGELAMQRLLPQLARLEASGDAAQRRIAADILTARLHGTYRRDVTGGLAVAERLTALMPTVPDRSDPAQAAHWLSVEHILGVTYFQNLRLAQAEQHFRASDALRHSLGPTWDRQHNSHPAWHAMLLDLTGRHAEAEKLFALAHRLERESDAGAKQVYTWVLNMWVRALLDAGRVQEALALAHTGSFAPGAPPSPGLAQSPAALVAQARALTAAGRPAEALERLARAEPSFLAQFPTGTPPGERERAEALAALGRLDEAESALARAARQLDAIHELAGYRSRPYHLALIRLRIAQGDAAGARDALARARPVLLPEGVGERERQVVTELESRIARLARTSR